MIEENPSYMDAGEVGKVNERRVPHPKAGLSVRRKFGDKFGDKFGEKFGENVGIKNRQKEV